MKFERCFQAQEQSWDPIPVLLENGGLWNLQMDEDGTYHFAKVTYKIADSIHGAERILRDRKPAIVSPAQKRINEPRIGPEWDSS